MIERPLQRRNRENTMVRSFYNKLFARFVLIGVLLAGFGLCAYYAREVHPFEDEFTSMLVSQAVQRSILPILPSGAYYVKGLPYSIINALFVGLVQSAGNGSLPEALQVPYRLPSVFIGLLTIALIYRIGHDWSSPLTGLVAAGFLALSPVGIAWGAMVRMYGLAMCLVLLLVYAASKMGESKNSCRWRVVTLVTFVAATLNHPLTVLVLPPLLLTIVLWAWNAKLLRRHLFRSQNAGTLGVGGLVVGGTALVASALFIFGWIYTEYSGRSGVGSSVGETITTLLHFSFHWDSANKFLAKIAWESAFGLPLFVVAFGGGAFFLLLWIAPRLRAGIGSRLRWRLLSLFILSAGLLVEFLVIVIQYSTDERYWAPFVPLVYLLAGLVVEVAVSYLGKWRPAAAFQAKEHWASTTLALIVIAAVGGLGRSEISNLFYATPPAYEQALYFVKHHWQPGDVIVIPFPAASGMYLGRTDYFAADVVASQTKVRNKGDAVVDEWWGAPWIERGRQLQDLLQKQARVWFVIDKGHYRGLFQADWHFVEQQNMKLAWAQDNALIYVSGKPGIPLPDKPEHVLNANLSNVVSLQGYTSAITGSAYRVFLFWKVLSPLPYDFTQFVHIRDQAGKTVAQADFQPLKGEYPTRYWRPGEVVVDVVDIPIPAGIAAGEYRVLAGLYRWETLERLPVTGDTTGENAVELERVQVGPQTK
jgi:hypothetical protein